MFRNLRCVEFSISDTNASSCNVLRLQANIEHYRNSPIAGVPIPQSDGLPDAVCSRARGLVDETDR